MCKIRVPTWSSSFKGLLSSCRLLTSQILTWQTAERRNKLSNGSHKSPIPCMRTLLRASSNPYYLPKALPPNTITLGGTVSTYEFGWETHIQSIAIVFDHLGYFITL